MRGEAARPGKRPIRSLTAAEKMEAIQRVNDGESKASVARDIGVPESTLRGWCKSEKKIRQLVNQSLSRNSATPDSEVHSPATAAVAGTSTSEDEAAGPSQPKRMRMAEEADSGANGYKFANDYATLLSSLVAGGNVRPEQSALLLQQLGILQSANLTKSLMGLSNPHTVGLVENGLQYTKSMSGPSNSTGYHRRTTSSPHISAIAPSTQMDAINMTRKSLPPAAEAPSTPVPATPRRTSGDQLFSAHCSSSSSSSSKKDNDRPYEKSYDNSLSMWLAQQHQQIQQQQMQQAHHQQQPYVGQAVGSFNPTGQLVEGSWFWQVYKKFGYLLPPSAAGTFQIPPQLLQQLDEADRKRNKYKISSVKKSPSKARAYIDDVLCFYNNNNNTNKSVNNNATATASVAATANGISTSNATASASIGANVSANVNEQSANIAPVKDEPEDLSDSDKTCSLEVALEHARKFKRWLERCSEPSITQLQIMQFSHLVDCLQRKRDASSFVKHRRK